VSQPDTLRLERDLLSHLLELARHDSPAGFATEALAQVVALVGQTSSLRSVADPCRGYIELGDPLRPLTPERTWSAHHGFDGAALDAVKRFLSRTIIRETLRSGEVLETLSASTDERFAQADSVQRNGIESVLCVPIGSPAHGVIYLQGFATDARVPSETRRLVELFAHHLAPIAGKLVASNAERADSADPTAPWRERLGGATSVAGKSPALAEALKTAAMVAALDMPVLLTGPTGTGKTVLARLIWSNGPRRQRAFAEFNCAALPEALIESELFGALPGAHSTATRRIPGKVEATEGGTLFLDEVGELPLGAQAKLLQLLQDKTYWPLGASQAAHADVRILAATNRDLDERVRGGAFRADLLYRLRVIPLRVPGLDERRGDIAGIAETVLAQAVARHGLSDLQLRPAALVRLTNADWSGHIRELGNALEAGAIRAHSDGSPFVEVEHLFPPRVGATSEAPSGWHDAVRAFQRRPLQDALDSHAGNIADAARTLGIARSHAYELVRQLGARR